MKRPKLAIFVPSFEGGGAERVMVTLANGFVSRGVPVDFLVGTARGPYRSELAEGVRIIDLKARRVLTAVPGLIRYLHGERPEALLSAMNHANLVAIIARKLSGASTRLVVSERTSIHFTRAEAKRSRRARAVLAGMRRLYRHADHVVVPAQAMIDEIVSLGVPRDRVTAICNPVDLVRIQALQRLDPPYPWFTEPVPIVVGAGRLSSEKSFDTLIDAVAEVRKDRRTRLLLCGEGPERANLQARADAAGLGSDFLMPGFVPNPFAILARCAVFVLSSRNEGLPNTLIQALACGARVVSTDCPTGPAEILDEGRWGRMVPVGDVRAMARAIALALDERTPLGQYGALSRFELDDVIDQYLAILNLPMFSPKVRGEQRTSLVL